MSKQRQENDTLRNLLLAGSVFLIVMWVGPLLLPTPPQRPPSPEQDPPAAAKESDSPLARPVTPPADADRPAATAAPQDAPAVEASDETGWVVAEADAETTIEMGSVNGAGGGKSAQVPYRMHLVLSNRGASVATVKLTDHADTVGSQDRYQLLHPITTDDAASHASFTVEKINVDGTDIDLADKLWKASRPNSLNGAAEPEETDDGQRTRFTLDILRGGRPVVRLTRTFELPRQSAKSMLHDLRCSLQVENLDMETAHQVRVTYRGGVGVPSVDTRMDDRVVDVATRQADSGVHGARTTFASVVQQGQSKLFARTAPKDNAVLSWAATGNKYFTCTLAPLAPSGEVESDDISGVLAVDLDGRSETEDDVTLRFVTSTQRVEAGESLTYPVDIYIGEKDGHAFKSIDRYAKRNYYFQVVEGYSSCTFDALVELMVWSLNGLHFFLRDFGLAIIALVLIVRTLLHPITKKGQVNMVRMQQKMSDFAPKMEELKRKYGNDKAKLQQETMQLYREHDINPAGQLLTCLPMVIQMPIWVALFISLSNNVLMRHQPFLFTWIRDLTAQDALINFSSPVVVPVFGWELPSFNLLPFLLALAMYAQQKLQPKPKPNPNMTDQQRQQQELMQKMMPMMSIMMLFIFYKMPSGLNLYIMASSFFGTIEQYRIRKHIKVHEEAGTLYKKPTGDKKADGRAKPSLWQKLQKMAEQAQHNQPRAKKPRRR